MVDTLFHSLCIVRRRLSAILGAIFVSLFSCCICLAQSASVGNCPSLAAVKSFYKAHLVASNTDYIEKNVLAKRRWLTKSLFASLVAERQRSAKSTKVPYLNGDPFTDSQEYPKSFSVGLSECKRTKATVKVIFPNQPNEKWVIVELVLQDRLWKISDIIYQDGSRLTDNLQK